MSNTLPLKEFHFQIKKAASPHCSICRCVENANHYIFGCKRYHIQRNRMLKNIKRKWWGFCRKKHFNARTFLYGFLIKPPENRPRTIEDKTQIMFWKQLCGFVADTGRFTSLFGDLVKVKVKEK